MMVSLTVMLALVLFGNNIFMSVTVKYMPETQSNVGCLSAIVVLGPCIFAASYPPKTNDPSILAFDVAPSSPHQYPYDLDLMCPASLRADSSVEFGPIPRAPCG